MSEAFDAAFDGETWDTPPLLRDENETLTLTFDSWEGPLDLLLTLARGQKVDLREISILALVEQYLAFIENVRALKLEVAADYLVMAAWLAYLKSGLLLPRAEQPDPSPEELALRLHLRLQRLHAMREAGARIVARDQIGRDVFVRPAPEGLHRPQSTVWTASLYDLLTAYGQVRARTQPVVHIVHRRNVMTLDEAIERVGRLVGAALDWASLESFLPEDSDPAARRSAKASSFVAALELARQRRLELRQKTPFAPLYLRAIPLREAAE
jgi:segregation and condensation protein A